MKRGSWMLPGLTRSDYRRPHWPPKIDAKELPSRAVSKARADELRAEWLKIAADAPEVST